MYGRKRTVVVQENGRNRKFLLSLNMCHTPILKVRQLVRSSLTRIRALRQNMISLKGTKGVIDIWFWYQCGRICD